MTVNIGGRLVGDGHPCFLVAEIGINHNGNVAVAKQLVDAAKGAHVDAVKFQKRTPELCVPEAQKNVPREVQGKIMTYLEYRHLVELDRPRYAEIHAHCRAVGMPWFASCWDCEAVTFIEQFSPPCYKVASASITDDKLLIATRNAAGSKPLLVSTGMSTLEQIDHAVEVLGKENLVLMHTVSTYPAALKDVNLRVMDTLRDRYGCLVGYSGHEDSLAPSIAAAARGACVIERHITLSRAMWGSDQAASLQPSGFRLLTRDIRMLEEAMGDGVKRVVEGELAAMKKLRL